MREGDHPQTTSSDYPEMAEYLVELGIDSMSVTPDTLLQITRDVLAVERRLGCPPPEPVAPVTEGKSAMNGPISSLMQRELCCVNLDDTVEDVERTLVARQLA